MPGPAPGAGAVIGGAVVVVVGIDELLTGVEGAGAGIGVAAGLLDENHERLVGVGDGAVGAGEVAAAVVAPASFFLERLLGLAAGAGAGAAVVDEEVVAVSFFLERLCFAGDVSGLAAGVGAWPSNEVVENPINRMIRPMNLFMVLIVVRVRTKRQCQNRK